ncbi:hypothetical protein LXA43DRAFT_1067801 [Ganoderma leucocontextum]|nr:hypothetical protein LXA43DRAFT_1067801 [Ganoderma leucocontextum]
MPKTVKLLDPALVWYIFSCLRTVVRLIRCMSRWVVRIVSYSLLPDSLVCSPAIGRVSLPLFTLRTRCILTPEQAGTSDLCAGSPTLLERQAEVPNMGGVGNDDKSDIDDNARESFQSGDLGCFNGKHIDKQDSHEGFTSTITLSDLEDTEKAVFFVFRALGVAMGRILNTMTLVMLQVSVGYGIPSTCELILSYLTPDDSR